MFSAVLEPDIDADCLGDETQDASVVPPLDPTSTCDFVPPQTEWIRKPPKRIRASGIRTRLRSNEPGGIFECGVDGNGWSPCSSGRIADVTINGVGKHWIRARAVDPAANVDPSPVGTG
jgi:hypothetical protein